MHRVTRSVSIAAATVAIALLAQQSAADAKEVPSAMMASIYAFANGDATANAAQLKAACMPNATIIDEFAPYQWSGAGSAERYAADVKAFFKASDLTDVHVAIEDPRYWDAKGDSAWVSVPATFWFVMGGKHATESGEFTFVLTKINDAWKVKTSAWTTTSLAFEH